MNPFITPIDRAEINKANAQHSTGPKTKAGKQKSALNALRHGLTGQIIVLPCDDLEAYQRHVHNFTAEYHPQSATESQLVQSLADTAWRQNRVAALETNLLTLGVVREHDQLDHAPQQVQQALAIAASLDSQTRALANLSLHGQRLARQFEKTLDLLRKLQAERQTERDYTLDQAANLVEMHEIEGEPYDPAEDGFVFSNDEIEAAIHVRNRTERAAQAASYLYNEEDDD
jgi:hypothetical protein